MLLKRLEVQGFKSFADKINIELEQGITAVVGPNGSGKSNIADAIRWLLGEREARNLRGAKSEDLIFAGTKDRPRVGLAQATLYFDNSSGFFPVDYKEISISRKVSRDGKSQIFLNKSEVRLKDIIDFFARSRMGARGLTIVSQGESDVFINSTPMERREMIEEILGLKEYQLKKSEALRRLKNALINLDKAKALIEELVPLMRVLKKQVAKYEGRAGIASELRELENNFYGGKLHALKSSFAKIEPSIKSLEEKIKVAEKDVKHLEQGLEEIKSSEPETNKSISEVQDKRKKLLDKKFAIQKALSRIEAKLEFATTPKSIEEARLIGALNDIKSISTEYSIKETVVELKQALSQIVSLVENLFGSKGHISADTEKERSRVLVELEVVDEEIKQLESAEREFAESMKGFNENFRKAFMEFEAARSSLVKLQEEKNKVNFEKERIDIRVKDLGEQIREAGRDIKEFETWAGEEVKSEEETSRKMFRLRGELAAIGDIDQNIVKEYKETETRNIFLTTQVADLEKAIADLHNLIQDLDYKIQHEFITAIGKINGELSRYMDLLFGGGKAKLIVEEKKTKSSVEEIENVQTTNPKTEGEESVAAPVPEGVYIDVSLPRKRIKGLEVLSGGERALVSVAALFALISVSPPPFLVLDDVDAPLDEKNARRFGELLKEFAKKTQFIIVTHNRATMEVANVLYGVTMSADGTSKVLSVKLS